MFFNNSIKSKINLWGKVRLFLGHAIAYFYEPSVKIRNLKNINSTFNNTYPENKLTPIELKRLEDYQIDTIQLKHRKDFFENHYKNNSIEKTFYGSVMPLIRNIINVDKNIKNILNIGCSYDFVDYLLAKEFPHIDFLGIDFPNNLIQINEAFLSKNFRVQSGYALEYLISYEKNYDITYFSSTANNIKNQELHKYCETLYNKTRYIILNEPIWIQPDRVIDPMNIDPNISHPGHVYRDDIHDRFGYLSYNHNYKKIIEKYGFEVIHYHTFYTDSTLQGSKIGRIQLVGKRI